MATRNTKRDAIYRKWQHMIQRCHNPNDTDYFKYGAKGISVCDRWRFGVGNVSGFTFFLEDMGEPPEKTHSIDRIDVYGNYSPDNCRWATAKEQARNRTNNTHITAFGKNKTQSEWCEQFNISHQCLRYRLKQGLTIEEALSKPIKGS